ncbi:hypothetical protein N7532_006748 [Penicillium argentinense]|uniref:Uncharacterized protein n=1 Tax=Penicillium argentinense TaxID=1131581 RepID=A0A9W9FGG8_9EURO|nr:uncharacterized protein N7532_006748 [Penicillium argentinense]KAJ5099747.1 hypothetical protein N7532_006748 [Penicillium argentinense]
MPDCVETLPDADQGASGGKDCHRPGSDQVPTRNSIDVLLHMGWHDGLGGWGRGNRSQLSGSWYFGQPDGMETKYNGACELLFSPALDSY